MENIINNPGLKHLAENIFGNLNYYDLEHCQCINESSKKMLETPMFWRLWLKKFIRLSNKNLDDWNEAIHASKHTELAPKIIRYLRKCSKNENVVDLPCHITKDTIKRHSQLIKDLSQNKFTAKNYDKHRNLDYIQILAIFDIKRPRLMFGLSGHAPERRSKLERNRERDISELNRLL